VVYRGTQDAFGSATDQRISKRDGCEVTISPARWSRCHEEVKAQEGLVVQCGTNPDVLRRPILTETEDPEDGNMQAESS
jgi:hypothetical protein